MNQSDASLLLDRYLRSRQPLVAIFSYEEARVMRAVRAVSATRSMAVVTWSFTAGLEGAQGVNSAATKDPAAAFAEILKYAASHPKTLFVLRDLHGFLGTTARGHSPVLVRYLRDISAAFETAICTMLLLSPALDIPADLQKGISVIDWPLPDADELAQILTSAENELSSNIPVHLNGDRSLVIEAMKGLTEFEARSSLASAIVACRELSDAVIPFIVKEKAQLIKRGGLLEFYDRTTTMADIGGLAELKRYANRKRVAMTLEARRAGLDAPKGCILLGPPGTGKSAAAKAIAGGTMPLVRMDVGALMGGLVGQSESNTRRALAQVEAIAPCILWMDEIEKALGGMGGGEQDGGTRMRVFGTILTWMQERQAEVYVVATANDVDALDPALVRRFDDVLFIDLPSQSEREAIAAIHLAKRRQDPGRFDLVALAAAAWGFSGAEIEKAISAALEESFVSGIQLQDMDLLAAVRSTKPVSQTMADQISRIRSRVNEAGYRLGNEGLEPAPLSAQAEARSLEI